MLLAQRVYPETHVFTPPNPLSMLNVTSIVAINEYESRGVGLMTPAPPLTTTTEWTANQIETEPKWNHPLLGVVLITMTLITIFGNVLVIFAIIRERYLKSVTYYFIASLAVADLIVGLFVMPFNSLNKMTNNFWFFGDVWYEIYFLLFF